MMNAGKPVRKRRALKENKLLAFFGFFAGFFQKFSFLAKI